MTDYYLKEGDMTLEEYKKAYQLKLEIEEKKIDLFMEIRIIIRICKNKIFVKM